MRMVIEEIEKDSVNRLLKLVAPGTAFRDGLESVLRAKTGALIIVGFSPEVMDIVDGGFSINSEFSPSYLYELAKMDGAIIVSEDFKRILYANTQLIPNPNIPSIETGTRHRTAERVAKQTGKLVVSISQRRNIITIYHEELRYALKDISVILNKANQAVSTLDKYKSVFDQSITNLGALEFEELVSLQDVVSVIQRGEMVKRIRSEVERYVNELGTEGRLVSMQLEELIFNIDAESKLLIQDYTVEEQDEEKIHEILHALRKLNSEELLDQNHIVRLLGHPYNNTVMDAHVSPRGHRVLNKIPRLPGSIVDNLIEEFGQFSHLMMATIDELDEVEGIGEVRARTIKDGLKRIQDQVLIDRHI